MITSAIASALVTIAYALPINGVVSSGVGWRTWKDGNREFHKGTDYVCSTGQAIAAAAEGEVTFAGPYRDGNLAVHILHADGRLTIYQHNSRLLVKVRQKVAQGQAIAECGSTGRSTGPHLHFQIESPEGAILTPQDLGV